MMRKSWTGVASASLLMGLVVSCGDTQGASVPNAAGGAAHAGSGGQSRGGLGNVGHAGSADSEAGDDAGGGADAANGGAASGDNSTAGGAEAGGGAEAAGGALAFGGNRADAGSSSLGEGGMATPAGGAAGNDAGGAGGAPAQTPSCDDNKAATEDFYSELYGCAHLTDDVPGGGDGWLYYDAGFYVDERTGAAWSPITTSGSLAAANTFCSNLQIGSLVDWRVPTIDEVRASFAGGCPATAPTGTCTIHDPTNLSSAEVYSVACESCLGSGTSAYCPTNAPFCQWLKTSSACSDCSGSQGWAYGPGNGNFAAIDFSAAFSISCVKADLPGGVL